MDLHLIRLAILFAATGPFLAIPALFVIFYLRRFRARKRKHRGLLNLGFAPSTYALGLSLQFLQMTFTSPSIEYVLQEKYEEEANQDEAGDPDNPMAQLRRQLKQIRSGKPVDRLIVRQQKHLRHE